MSKTASFVDPTYARTGTYGAIISEIAQRGVCPFCPETLQWHKKPILQRVGAWLITESIQPYVNTQRHLLIIGAEHKIDVTELTEEDWGCVRSLILWAEAEFDIKGGGLTLRFGDTHYTGATVSHLHFHLIVPELDENGRAKVVSFPIG